MGAVQGERWPLTSGSGSTGNRGGACLCRAGSERDGRTFRAVPGTAEASNCCSVVNLSHPATAALSLQRPQGVGRSSESSYPVPRQALRTAGCPRHLHLPAK